VLLPVLVAMVHLIEAPLIQGVVKGEISCDDLVEPGLIRPILDIPLDFLVREGVLLFWSELAEVHRGVGKLRLEPETKRDRGVRSVKER